jgi:aspartate aminotransferase
LKDAIVAKLKRDNGLEYKRSQIVVSCGAKHTLYNLAQALFDEGEEVIIPAPYWVSYPDIVVLAGGRPVIVNTKEKDGFKMKPEQLKAAITKRTRAVIINSPSKSHFHFAESGTGSDFRRPECCGENGPRIPKTKKCYC